MDDMGRVEVRVECPHCGDLFLAEVLSNTPSDGWLRWFQARIREARNDVRHAHVCKEKKP